MNSQLDNARQLLAKNDLKGAKSLIDDALRKNPDAAMPRHLLGIWHDLSGDKIMACTEMRRAQSLKDCLPSMRADLGLLLCKIGRNEDSLAELLPVEESFKGVALFYEAISTNYIALRRFDRAIQACEKVKVSVWSMHLVLNYLSALNKNGAPTRALTLLHKYSLQYSDKIELLVILLEVLFELIKANATITTIPAQPRHALMERLGFEPNSTLDNIALRAIFDRTISYIRQSEPENKYTQICHAQLCIYDQEYDQAQSILLRVIDKHPKELTSYTLLGYLNLMIGETKNAMEYINQALALKPDSHQDRFNMALAYFKSGDFAKGYPYYESRWKSVMAKQRREFTEPIWDGKEFTGKRLLVYCEQGFGDSIQFVRLLNLVKPLGGLITLEAPAPLVCLFKNSFSGIEVVSKGSTLPEFDLQIALLSLPQALAISIENIPAKTPYLFIDQQPQQLPSTGKFLKVGIVCQGNSAHKSDRLRSVTPKLFSALLSIPRCQFYSLHHPQAPEYFAKHHPEVIDLMPSVKDFFATAALIKQLDLVISVDSAVLHLSGALNIPCWGLLSYAGDWRWLSERNDSPWYPSMRLFRQQSLGDWQPVLMQVEECLQNAT